MIALDTNILAYAVAKSDPDGRHEAAIALLEKLASPGAVVPLPVFGEFFNACRKKKLATAEVATSLVEMWIGVFECPAPLAADYVAASRLASEHTLQYFDALILTVARRAGAALLLSEDMHDGLEVEGLRILNPFNPANDAVFADWFGGAQ